ncbi:hypothetical protein [Blastopirellula retiformator]|uniref:Tetratricopeptide repeat protein n=1 Tax=Blastopirellula retiformator TaxID=2527970 RepID=A0A5C5V0Q8_9BACT|nr:hypothetical protein [Blastopirellula retiformator]TWT31971.1 hypothetical protein Enr8_38970 [Blastopirellula retiformator]
MRLLFCLSIGMSLVLASVSSAQVVQLPELRNFSVGTSVLVPDRGATYGGGVMRRSETSGQVGSLTFPSGRSMSTGTSASNSWVHAYIHPTPAEMDEILLGKPSTVDPTSSNSPLRMIGAAREPATGSLAAIRRQLSAEDAAANRKAIKYADMAETCVKQGKLNIAKLFYRSAIDTATGEYQQQLQTRLEQIEMRSSGANR